MTLIVTTLILIFAGTGLIFWVFAFVVINSGDDMLAPLPLMAGTILLLIALLILASIGAHTLWVAS